MRTPRRACSRSSSSTTRRPSRWRRALADVDRRAHRPQPGEPGLHRRLQSGAARWRAASTAGLPQQRHDRHAGLARGAAATPSRCSPTPAWSAPSWSIPTAACRKPAASCSATARAGTTAASTIRPTRATTTCAKPTTARAPVSRSPRAVRSARRLRRALRPGLLRGHRPRLHGARRRAQVLYQPRATVVHFEGITSGTDIAAAPSASGHQPGEVRAEVGARTRRAPRQRRPAGARARPGRARRVLVIDACTPTPDQDSGSVRMHRCWSC